MHRHRRLAAAIALTQAVIATAAPRAGAEIVDNSFFVEEAYNQERGIVQHIQTVHWTWNREGGSTVRGVSYALTQEWPLSGQRHQISYTLPYERRFGDGPSVRGVGDVQVHYRIQIVAEGANRPAVTPRVTVILPTGDERKGLGAGTAGVQVNLPVSKQLQRAHVHVNAGAAFVPDVRAPLAGGGSSPAHDLAAANLGFSVIALLSERLHLLLETVTSVEEEIDEAGGVAQTTRVLVSPGLRFGIDRKDGGQWVLGLAAPLGVNDAEDDAGIFLYLSFEHPF